MLLLRTPGIGSPRVGSAIWGPPKNPGYCILTPQFGISTAVFKLVASWWQDGCCSSRYHIIMIQLPMDRSKGDKSLMRSFVINREIRFLEILIYSALSVIGQTWACVPLWTNHCKWDYWIALTQIHPSHSPQPPAPGLEHSHSNRTRFLLVRKT